MNDKEKEIIHAAYHCVDGLGCNECPLESRKGACTFTFANFIKIVDLEGRFKDTEKEPAPVEEVTDSKSDMYENKSHKNNNTPAKKSQVLLNTILELADDIISDDNADTEIAGYAGTIKGLTYSLRELVGGADNG